ncbi:MAG: glycosyltransferase [Alphaproteobacteria bacterium]|nr:MAG: glycosyltransferase [Alphaproteobacteria bacterium]
MIRVAHVYKEFHPFASGVARHIDGLATAVMEHGIAITIVAPDQGEVPQGRAYARVTSLAAGLAGADIVHVHGARTPIAMVAAQRAGRRPVIYTPHCYYDDGGWLRRSAKRVWDATAERWLVRRAAATWVLHDGWIADLANRGLPTDTCRVLPNAVLAADLADRRAISPLVLDGRPALLIVGRLDPVKRLEDAIAALTAPGLADAVLHLVGRGPDLVRLQALAAPLGTRVRFHGWQPDSVAAAMVAGADLILLPSQREGMPTALIEALLLGRPVLTSNIPGSRSVLDTVGWPAYHTVADPADLAAAILRHAGTPPSPAVIAATAAAFTWEQVAPHVATLYREALDG